MTVPLYFKYQTAYDRFYLYDTKTNEILRVSEEIFTIIDNYGVLTPDAIIDKYKGCFAEQTLRDALEVLDEFSMKGVLRPHIPCQRPEILGIRLYDKTYSLEEFLNTFSRMLTLELTHRCNLNCEYCCFGKHYAHYRSHGMETMPEETAKQAIRYHLDKPESGRTITFYGGEPLLEFSLLQRLVLYAEQYCFDKGKEPPRFSLTTNGTLLTDDICRFFVEHNFSVLISLDGCQESHDRYRVFRSNGQGTFDLIMKNLLQFAELYPDFMGRGLSLTLTADNDFYETNRVVKGLMKSYPTLIVNFVNSNTSVIRNAMSCECEQKGCTRPQEYPVQDSLPAFLNWTPDVLKRYQDCQNQFQETLFLSPETARNEFPIFHKMFEGDYRNLHKRTIKRHPLSPKVACGCIPGAVRLYCAVEGTFYPCEKVEAIPHLCIGNIENGIDHQRVSAMIEYLGNETECDACAGKEFCSICPNYVTENNKGEFDRVLIANYCARIAENSVSKLVSYTKIMENQPSLFDIYKTESTGDDWLPHIQFVIRLTKSREATQRTSCRSTG
jgi:uncharacterized protein